MKKIFFSFLAIAALASCAKTEAVFTPDNSEIKIAPVTAMNTKAQAGVIDGIEYPASEKFNVYAYWANQPAGSLFEADETTAGAYLSNVTFVNKGKYWGGATTQYWPKNGSLRFAAYSPADKINNMTHNLAADTYELNGFTYPTTVGEMYDILVAPTSKSYTAQTAAENVSVVFEHALSWITFKIKSVAPEADAFTVKEVILNNVNNQGSMVADMKAGTKTWSTDDPQAVTVFDQAAGRLVPTNPTEAPIFENAGNNGTQLLVLPQATTSVTINFTQNEVGSAPALPNQTVTIPLTLDGGQPWEAGKHYTYTVVFDLDEILINPSVEDWEEVDVPEIDATPAVVATAEELQAAVEVGKSVRLADDIQLTNSILVGNSVQTRSALGAPVEVVIDLNGKNIIAPSTDAIVVENGATLTINGDGKVWAATDDKSSANAVWVKHGFVTINGGNYYVGADNEKRNDCIYVGAKAYDAVAAEKHSELTINGGRFEAKVEEDGQYWVLNLRDTYDKAGSMIIVKGGEYVKFDPSSNLSENPELNFCADGYGSYELTENVWTVVSKTAEIQVKSEAALIDAATQGANVVLAADITLNKLLAIKGNVALNLNGKTITAAVNQEKGTSYALVVYPEAELEINGNGTVVTSEATYSMPVWAWGGKVVINDGYYENAGDGCDLIYASNGGEVTINGGTFKATKKLGIEEGTLNEHSALNIKDSDRANSKIVVYGGKYFRFDPANNLSEGEKTNFVSTGYKSYAVDADWYVVVKE